MSDGRTGDHVNFADDERLDKPDILAIGSLVEQAIVRNVGTMMGFASGCVTTPTITYVSGSNGGVWQLGSFTAWDASNGTQPATNAYDGRVLRFDASSTHYSTSAKQIDFGSWTSAGPVAWIRRTTTDEDIDARRRWNLSTGAEDTFSLATRGREYVEFTTTANFSTVPSASGGAAWVPFAYISAYNSGGSSVTIRRIPVWDGLNNNGGIFSGLAATAATAHGQFASSSLDGGLAYFTYLLRLYMGYMQDNTLATNWATVPPRGLKQVDTALDTLEAYSRVIAVGKVYIPSVSYDFEGSNLTLDSATDMTTFRRFVLSITGVASYTAQAVFITPLEASTNTTKRNAYFFSSSTVYVDVYGSGPPTEQFHIMVVGTVP